MCRNKKKTPVVKFNAAPPRWGIGSSSLQGLESQSLLQLRAAIQTRGVIDDVCVRCWDPNRYYSVTWRGGRKDTTMTRMDGVLEFASGRAGAS